MKVEEYSKKIELLKDQSSDIRSLGKELTDAWGFDLNTRKVGVAYVNEDGDPVTKLDMVCMMATLVDWEPILIVPGYKATGPKTHKEGQIVVNPEKRHGKLTALVSHQDRFNFSFRMLDMGVMGAKDVGDYRTFSIFTDGDWNPGFHNLQFQPTEEEKMVLAKIADGSNQVAFDTFIHLSRWPSLYGRYYRLAKHTINRMAGQLKVLTKHVAELRDALGIEKDPWPATETGPKKPKTVWKFNLEVAPLEYTGEFQTFPVTQDGYTEATRLQKRIRSLQEILRFQTRATEFAFFHHIKEKVGEDNLLNWTKVEGGDSSVIPMAAWMKGREWKVGWQVPPRKANKKFWCRMELDNNDYLQFHVNQMTVQVADEDSK